MVAMTQVTSKLGEMLTRISTKVVQSSTHILALLNHADNGDFCSGGIGGSVTVSRREWTETSFGTTNPPTCQTRLLSMHQEKPY